MPTAGHTVSPEPVRAGPGDVSRALRGVLWMALFLAWAAQALEIPCRGIDPDELEHLHAAFSVARGEVPYRDFFEHHGPAFYYLLQPLFWWRGVDLSVLWLGRAAMGLCSLAAIVLTGRLARRVAGPRAALPAMCLLAWTTIFHAKAIELRPDVPAMLLLLAVVSASIGGDSRRPAWHWLGIGVLAGLATLFTQKSIVPIAGLAFAGGLQELLRQSLPAEARLFRKRRASDWLCGLRVPCLFAIGGAFAWGATMCLFATAGAAEDLLHSTVRQLWIWPLASHTWDHLRPTLAADLLVWLTSAVECVAVARACRHSETWTSGRGVVAVTILACASALFWAKAAYPQFYLLWMPLLSAFAARRLVIWSESATAPLWKWGVCGGGFLFLVMEFAVLARSLQRGDAGALPHLTRALPPAFPATACAAGVLCALAIALLFAARHERTHSAIALLAALGTCYAAARNVDRLCWSNAEQVAAIAAVNAQVPADQTVLDGFTGYAALRPHAYYYWWINGYSLALMSPADRETKLLEHLKANPPAAVLLDHDLQLLPQPVIEWIKSRYHPVAPPPLWRKND